MLTMEEKLQHFSHLVFSHAQNQRGEMLEQAREEAKKQVDAYEHECLEHAYRQIQKQLTGIEKRANESVASLQLELRKELLLRRKAMTDEVFDGVTARLRAFRAGEAYAEYLKRSIRAACEALGEGEKDVYLCPSDEPYIPALRKSFPDMEFHAEADAALELGGARVLNRRTHQLFDDSLDSRLRAEKERFLSASGLSL